MDLKDLLNKAFNDAVKKFVEEISQKGSVDKEKLEKAIKAILILEFESQLKAGNTPIGFSIVGKGTSTTLFFAPGGLILKAVITRATSKEFEITVHYMDKEEIKKIKGEEKRRAMEIFYEMVDGIVVYTDRKDSFLINKREKADKIFDEVYMPAWGNLAKQLPIPIFPVFPKPNRN